MRSARTPLDRLTTTRMPIYTLAPRRSMHYQHPFAPVFGPSFCTPAVRATPSLVPSLFRGLEEELSTFDNFFNNLASTRTALRTYAPRFDVREEKDAFHLTGELPGVDAQNLSVEFVDRNTMVVKGRTVRESQRGNAPAALEEQAAAQDKGKQKAVEGAGNQTAPADDAMETEQPNRAATPASTASSSNYHKASVEESREEGDDFVDVAAENTTTAAEAGHPTTASSKSEHTVTTQPQEQPAKSTNTENAKERESHYWVSERSVGEFHRSFRFPGQVDQENVKANLKDGVLRVVVPKARALGPRRIAIE